MFYKWFVEVVIVVLEIFVRDVRVMFDVFERRDWRLLGFSFFDLKEFKMFKMLIFLKFWYLWSEYKGGGRENV